MKKNEKIFLGHVLESIEMIEGFTKEISREKFLDSPLIQETVMRRIEVIGEAVKNIPPEFKAKHPQIEWKSCRREQMY